MARKPASTKKKVSDAAASDQPLLSLVARRQFIFWSLALLVFVGILVLLRSILLPFIAGMVLAYFMDPVADRLEKFGASRIIATSVILIVFLITFLLALFFIVPELSQQVAAFIERLPGYATKLRTLLTDSQLVKTIIGEDGSNLRENFDKLMEQGASWLGTLISSLWSSGKALVDILSLLVITPIVAFYLLLDWDRMIAKVDDWLPRDHQSTIRKIAHDMDRAIAGFIRGQGSVCVMLGVFYALALTLTGLNFGLLIGLFAGIISFIPYVGSMVGFVLAIGVALVQFWPDYTIIGIIAAIFVVGQFVEGNFLQPRLVGKSVGLHPVWLMFALAAFGALLGFTGLLIAVPVSAAIGVLVRFALSRYLQSPLYRGHDKK
ncbi:MAG: AI-2E family transporter [Hyphomicrobiales bacterium]|nr:MAG: AI-2E family transporter [Hyphomicrobiales bacterium]